MQIHLKVLTVEDSEDDALLLAREFRKGGFGADFTRVDTQEALRSALGARDWDMVLCDYSMPHFSGMAALTLIREMAPDLPVIFVSGTMGEELAVEAMRAGANDYLMKGNLKRLLPAVERELRDTVVRVARKGAEEALCESEERYRAIFQNSPLGIFRSTFEGRFLEVNPAMARMHGYDSPEAFIRGIHDIGQQLYVRLEDLQRIVSEQLGSTDFTQRITLLRRKDGSEFTANLYLKTIHDAEGRPVFLEGIIEDITERKRAEDALRQSERKKSILNRIANIFLTVQDDEMYGKVLAVILEVMESKFGIFGFIGENGDLVIPSVTREVWNQCQASDKSLVLPPATWGASLWGMAIREKKTFCSDGPFHVPEGHLRIDRFLTVPIVFGTEAIGLISVANGGRSYTGEDQDLLESVSDYVAAILNARRQRDRQEQRRKSAEDTLRKLSRAVEQSSASIVIANAAGVIEYVNPKFTKVTGYSQAEALGQNSRLLKSGETSAEEYRQLWQTITSGKEWRGEFHNRKKSGELFWEMASISPIFDSAGVITHFVAVKEDITEHKCLEQEFRQAQKLEAVGQLAGGVAHDFNNILTAILMNLSLLKDDTRLAPETVAGLVELEREANRAVSLTRQLLMFSRRQVLDAKSLDLKEAVNNMTKMLRRLIGEDIELVFQGQDASQWVMADAGMMDQLLMNLCVNARDAMPQGGRLTIGTRRIAIDEESARLKPEAHPGVFICLSVTDTGCGMDEETLKHIFEPFFTTKEVGKGTGLGLATVYGIVNQHRGWIVVESALGKGTTFHIYLPALREALLKQAPSGHVNIRGGTETILVAEDDQALLRLAALSLRKLGYAVLEASNGAEAIELWEQHQSRIDLLFTDMVMPAGFTGIDLAERFRKDKPALRVIATSGYTTEKSQPDMLAAKGIAFVAKPYEAVGLASAVRSCLDQGLDYILDR